MPKKKQASKFLNPKIIKEKPGNISGLLFYVKNHTFLQKLVYALIHIILTLIFSYFLYRFYEKPMTDIRDKSFFVKKRPKV